MPGSSISPAWMIKSTPFNASRALCRSRPWVSDIRPTVCLVFFICFSGGGACRQKGLHFCDSSIKVGVIFRNQRFWLFFSGNRFPVNKKFICRLAHAQNVYQYLYSDCPFPPPAHFGGDHGFYPVFSLLFLSAVP